VDIAATVGAAYQAFAASEPVGRTVDPALTTSVAQGFTALEADAASLGPPTQVPDAAIPATLRLSVSQQVDATAADLARLAARLAPLGTAGAPTY
jgi:hypothetical protein